MDLKRMQALANQSTGLVPMVIKRAFAPWTKNSIAGFPPETALAHFNEGVAVVLGYDAPGEFNPVDDDRETERRAPGAKEKPKAAKEPKVPTIPDNWEALLPLKKVKLAMDLGWAKPAKEAIPAGMKAADLAHDFIKMAAELKAAEAAPKP